VATTALDCDLLVVDETSMIDVMLKQPLMKAVPDRLRRAGGNCQRVVNRVLSKRALGVASTASEILGTARSDEHSAALARSGQAG
jgi:hypothetical protein